MVALSKYSKSQIVQSDQIHNYCHLIMTPSPQSVSILGSAYHGRGHVGDRAPMWEGRIGALAVAKDGGRKFHGGRGASTGQGLTLKLEIWNQIWIHVYRSIVTVSVWT